jgi:sterol desaturase/sphingolipid hydroxylase (fatty acid hydroxylase superfamily)
MAGANSPSSVETVVVIVAVMAVVALIEVAMPLRDRSGWNRARVRSNLALTLITFATNAGFNALLVAALLRAELAGFGPLRALSLPPAVEIAVVVLVLDLTFYISHVAMHHVPAFWRFHRVHHSDPLVDVTTTIRQHPGEGVIRYAFLAITAIALGASPYAFAVYRLWSALNGLLEHANVRVAPKLDALLATIITTPNMHKVHHSRVPHETNSNYGNIFSIFDRALGTFTPTQRGLNVNYGLDELDHEHEQTTPALLGLPFRRSVLVTRVIVLGLFVVVLTSGVAEHVPFSLLQPVEQRTGCRAVFVDRDPAVDCQRFEIELIEHGRVQVQRDVERDLFRAIAVDAVGNGRRERLVERQIDFERERLC